METYAIFVRTEIFTWDFIVIYKFHFAFSYKASVFVSKRFIPSVGTCKHVSEAECLEKKTNKTFVNGSSLSADFR